MAGKMQVSRPLTRAKITSAPHLPASVTTGASPRKQRPVERGRAPATALPLPRPQGHYTFSRMNRTVWIVVAIVAVIAAAVLGIQFKKASDARRAEMQRAAELEKQLETARAAEREAQTKADQEAEARRLFMLQAQREAEAEARRLAQAQAEMEEQEKARRAAEAAAAAAAAEAERIRQEREKLAAEAQRLAELREKERAEAERKLAEARAALQAALEEKEREIARQAALIASYNKRLNRVEKPEVSATADTPAPEKAYRPRIIMPPDFKRSSHLRVLLPSEN